MVRSKQIGSFAKTMIILILVFCASFDSFSQKMQFEEPERLSFKINSGAEESMPVLTPDGNTLYFARIFHNGNTGGALAGQDIWYSTKDKDNNWSKAKNDLTV